MKNRNRATSVSRRAELVFLCFVRRMRQGSSSRQVGRTPGIAGVRKDCDSILGDSILRDALDMSAAEQVGVYNLPMSLRGVWARASRKILGAKCAPPTQETKQFSFRRGEFTRQVELRKYLKCIRELLRQRREASRPLFMMGERPSLHTPPSPWRRRFVNLRGRL